MPRVIIRISLYRFITLSLHPPYSLLLTPYSLLFALCSPLLHSVFVILCSIFILRRSTFILLFLTPLQGFCTIGLERSGCARSCLLVAPSGLITYHSTHEVLSLHHFITSSFLPAAGKRYSLFFIRHSSFIVHPPPHSFTSFTASATTMRYRELLDSSMTAVSAGK